MLLCTKTVLTLTSGDKVSLKCPCLKKDFKENFCGVRYISIFRKRNLTWLFLFETRFPCGSWRSRHIINKINKLHVHESDCRQLVRYDVNYLNYYFSHFERGGMTAGGGGGGHWKNQLII